jgi:hypothetical protein
MVLLDLSQMFDGAQRFLSTDELSQKFQQAGLDSSLKLVNFPCSLVRKKLTFSRVFF